MRTKKRIALLLAALLLASLLAGCAETAPESAPEPSAAPEIETPAAEPAEEPEREPGCNLLTIYWYHDSANYDKCDVWVWFPGREGRGVLFQPCDYGVKCVVNVPEDVSEVGFIVRRDCSNPGGSSWGEATKDFEDDRYVVMDGDTEAFLKPGDGTQYLSKDGGKTLYQSHELSLAGILSPREIRYYLSPAVRLTSLDQIHVRADGQELKIESLSSLNNEVITGIITLEEALDVTQAISVEIEGYGEQVAVPTGIFDSPEFIEAYVYEGDDLGAVIRGGETCFKLWAPTASRVVLNLFEAGDGGSAYESVDMQRGDKGVWSFTAPCGHGTYYTYPVTTASGTAEAVDPYARAVGVNGNRGMVVDLRQTDPEGFRTGDLRVKPASYGDAIVWEVHVRDFSNTIASSQYPGKYLAFTETGLTNSSGLPVGVDYLKYLGITHVHLQPVYDYATVDESSDAAQFNWGYDPKNYNAPEGSYSTDPWHGEVRIREFKQMVQALHEAGLGVVMDLVYNHTYALDSNLNRIVPYYYYRFKSDGSPSNGSGCGNETASERAMMRKYMVDSIRYWASEYQLDGFRFDLMALHDLQTMQEIEQALHAVNPNALLYGEGWTGGSSPLRDDLRASQANIRTIEASPGAIGGVAVFNDVIRDGLKGSVFDQKDTGYATGSVSSATAEKTIFGLTGGVKSPAANWRVENAMVVNYTSAHDNNTLWDKLLLSCPSASVEERLAMNRLCGSIVLMSRGMPFFLAGEEMLRTKGGDGNSYMSSDAVNNIDWEALKPDSDAWAMVEYYRQLIALRRGNRFFTEAEVAAEKLEDNAILVTWSEGGRVVACAVINPNPAERPAALPEGNWTLLLGESLESVPARSVLLVKST